MISLLATHASGSGTFDTSILLLIGHLIGAVLGAGGATASDVLFFKAVKDGKITAEELSFLKSTSLVVWSGVIISVVTGFLLLFNTPEVTAADHWPRILVKIIIALVIVINGIVLHLKIMPLFERHLHMPLITPSFVRKAPLVFTSGAMSAISWYSEVVIGGWRTLEASFFVILGVYTLALLIAVLIGNIIGFFLLRSFRT